MKFRSKFEKTVYNAIPAKHKRRTEYEPNDPVVRYTLSKRYIPDFVLPNGVLIECKGYYTSADRTKMLRIRKDNPSFDIRFVFQRANNKLTKSKNSKTYWQWCEQHGFLWSEESIPESWYR